MQSARSGFLTVAYQKSYTCDNYNEKRERNGIFNDRLPLDIKCGAIASSKQMPSAALASHMMSDI
jgi:hypothetical protein